MRCETVGYVAHQLAPPHGDGAVAVGAGMADTSEEASVAGPSKGASDDSKAAPSNEPSKRRKTTIQDSESSSSSDSDGEDEVAEQGSQPRRIGQASLHDMRGVVDWRQQAALPDVPTTLYLGIEDVRRLREQLCAATAACDTDLMLIILRRLSAMPCTLPLLARSGIGKAVGKLRKHDNETVKELALRLVKVWKKQLADQKSKPARGLTPFSTGKRPASARPAVR